MQHQPSCESIAAHVEKVYAEEVEGIPSLERLVRDAVDDFRAEQLALDPTYYEVVKRIRADTIGREGRS